MEHFFTTVPGIIIAIGGIIAVAIIGAMYVVGLWKGKKDDADDRLIKILKETVDTQTKNIEDLDKKVTKLQEREKALTEEVHELRKDNKKYIDILQGRDQQTQEFYKQAFEAMKVSKETYTLVAAMATGMADTNKNIEKMIDLISKHADVIDHSITSNK